MDHVERVGPRLALALALALTAGLVALCSSAMAQGSPGPEVRLDTAALVADIRQSRTIADTLTAGNEAPMRRLRQSRERLQALNCEPDDRRSACREPREAMRAAYRELLDHTDAQLPRLRAAVERIAVRMQSRVAANGSVLSADGQDRLLGKTRRLTSRDTPALIGVSGSRLSTHLGKLQRLVGGSPDNLSIDTIAADVYLDMRESLRLIDMIDDAVSTSKMRLALSPKAEYASLLDDETIEDIHRHLFGQAPAAPTVPERPHPSAYRPVRSELEL